MAEDLVAETFLAAFTRRDRFQFNRAEARPWLYGIAGNVIRRHGREEAHRLRLLARLGPDLDEAEPAEDVVRRVSAQAGRALLAHGLAALSGPDREVLILIAWEDLTYDEVATALAIPVGTVRSRLHRTRRQMRQALNDRHPTYLPATLEEMLGNG